MSSFYSFVFQSINLNSKRVQQIKVRPHHKAVRHNARQPHKNQRMKYNSLRRSQNYRLICTAFISKILNTKDGQG